MNSKLLPAAMFQVCFLGAIALYKPAATDALEQKSPGLFAALAALKESFDGLYSYYVAKVQQRFAILLNFLEQVALAGLIIRGCAGLVDIVTLPQAVTHRSTSQTAAERSS